MNRRRLLRRPSFAGLVIVMAILPAGCGKGGGETAAAISSVQSNDAATAAEIRTVLDRYVKAVTDADENILRELWADPEHVSYVNPMQRLRSWSELQGFWQGFLKNSFTQRELKLSNVAIQAVGDAAWAVFDWEFRATQTDGKPSQSRGWETQVYRRTDRGWRLSHAHYSVPATPPPTGGQAGQ
jgi:ketosteroid isomerase-like protein